MTLPPTPPTDPLDEPEAITPPRPMYPRRRLRVGHPPQAIPRLSDEDDDPDAPPPVRHELDPVFGYILAMALSVGLMPLQANARYVLLWAFMAAMGGMAFLLGSGIRLKVTDPADLLWGIGLGAFTGGALMLTGGDTLRTVAERIFGAGAGDTPLLDTWIFQATVFVMPIAESLFFRGAMQRVYAIPVVAGLASVWSMLMFFPALGLGEAPAVGVVLGTAIVLLNFLYSYVHWRHGLAASFFCQVVAGTLLLLVPRVLAM